MTPQTIYTVHGILQASILEWVAFPFSRASSQPRSSALQADSLPAEPQGKPKNTGVGSLSLLHRADLPNPGIEPRFHTLQADCLPIELYGKLMYIYICVCVCIYIFIYNLTYIIVFISSLLRNDDYHPCGTNYARLRTFLSWVLFPQLLS